VTDRQTFITPAEMCRLLEPLGYDPGVRTLAEWRRRQALPALERRPPAPGWGPGSAQGWTEPHIAVQICTLQVARTMHARVEEWMKLAAWFAGFDYRIDQIRVAWTRWCRRTSVDAAGRELGAPISDAQRPKAALAIYNCLPPKQRRPAILAAVQAALDPTFTEPTQSQLDDAVRLLHEQQPDFHAGIGEAVVRGGFAIQRILGSTGVETMLGEASDEQIAGAHQDARFLLTPFRLVAAEMIDTGDGAALGTLLFFLISIGRQVHTAAFALRHAGYGDRLDATIDQLRVLCARPVVQEAFRTMVTFMHDNRTIGPTDLADGLPPPEALSQFGDYWADGELWGAFSAAWPGIAESWKDLVGPLIDAFLDLFDSSPAGAS
jgi:hypothetical protein